MNQPLLTFSSSSQLPKLSQPLQNWSQLGPCSELDFGLREHCGWFDFCPDHSNFLHISNKVVPSSSLCVWSSTLMSFKHFSICIYKLANWCKWPSFWAFLAFDMSSSLSLIISSFGFKVRDVLLFLSLELLGAAVGLFINWPNFNIVESQGIGRQERDV